MRLAGTYHPISYLLERIEHFLPGVDTTSALWLGFDKQIYSTNDSQPLREYLKVQAQNIRSVKHISEWSKNDNLFENNSSFTKQLSINDEDAMNVLRLYFTSPIDNQKDMLVITFPNNVFLKSLNSEFKGISTQEKHILSSLLSSILTAEYEKAVTERAFLKQVEQINKKQVDKIKQLKENLKSTEQLYSSAVRNILNDFKLKLEKELSKEFIFNDKVVFKLAKERLTIEQIESTIKNAIFLAYNLNLTEHKIIITEEHIQLEEINALPAQASIPIENERKTITLLNRYEEAAIKAKQKGLHVNGKNIAAQLDPPITPPAITDAVKKNKSKISYLLQQYPERWTNSRLHIKPISNLDQNTLKSRAVS